MGINDWFYFAPTWAQEIILSGYGALEYHRRRSGNYKIHKKSVEDNHLLTADELASLSAGLAERAIRYALDTCEAYDAWRGVGENDKLNVDELLERLPLTTKGNILKDPASYLSRSASKTKQIRLKTTGSTGTPLEIASDLDARKQNYAFFDWFIGLHGGGPRVRKITIAGRKVVNFNRRRPPYWLYDWFSRTLYMSAYHIGPDTLSHYCEKMRKFRPVYIDSYPSVLYEVAIFALKKGIDMPRPKFICTSSETLHPYQREAIERAFGAPVRDQYGAAEMCIFGYECQFGVLHIRQDYSWVELKSSSALEASDEECEVICTPFINSAMPLLRYVIGDVARKAEAGACGCGSAHLMIAGVEGRRDDAIIGKSGRKYSRLSPVLKGFPIVESQFVLLDDHKLVVKVVPTEKMSPKKTAALEEHLEEVLGHDFTISIEVHDSIPRGPGGKYRAVINSTKGARKV